MNLYDRRRALALALGLVPPFWMSRRASAADATTGSVMGESGHPVAGARVGTSFSLARTLQDTGVNVGYGSPAVLSDTRGTFSLPTASIKYSHVLVAAGPDGTLGFATREESTPTRIVLKKPARLRVEVVKRFGHTHPFSIDLMSAGSAVAYGSWQGAVAEFVMPQGALQLAGVGDPESVAVTENLTLSVDRAVSVRLELQPAAWARNLGKPAPGFTPTDVHNWPSSKPFISPQGKWVLVTFWATWCLPCVREMPELMDFYSEHSSLRGKFELIAVHSPDGASFAGIAPQYQRLVQVWKGRSIPFPMVFDSTGTTQKAWGADAYPMAILVDPAGKIVGAGNLDGLKQRLGIGRRSVSTPTDLPTGKTRPG